jgi:hypothetical protein
MERADLDEAFRAWAEGLTAKQRRALLRWQADNNGYAEFPRYVREPGVTFDRRLDGIVVQLTTAILAGRTPADLVVWRGVRSSVDAFGVAASRLHELVGVERVMEGFLSTSFDEDVVRDAFLDPAGTGGAVLIELGVRAGTPAAWLPLGGWSGQTGECELLLLPGRRILVGGVTSDGDQPILRGEVL